MIDRDSKEIREEMAAVMEEAEAEKTENSGELEILRGYLADLERDYGIVIPVPIQERLAELEINLKSHNKDARVIYEAIFQIYHWRRKMGGEGAPGLNIDDLGAILAAALLHDIGKSGPANARQERREIVSRLYNLEALPNGKETPINEAVKMLFAEAERFGRGETSAVKLEFYFSVLRRLGFDTRELMPSFWRAHTGWTRDILMKYLDQNDPLYRRLTKIAASHHYFEGNNPENIDFKRANLSEEERRDNFLIKILIVLDQYQGVRRRGRKTPEQALEFIREKIAKRGLAADPECAAILDLVKKVEEKTAIFRLGTEIEGEVKK